jgi:hypothetical protein
MLNACLLAYIFVVNSTVFFCSPKHRDSRNREACSTCYSKFGHQLSRIYVAAGIRLNFLCQGVRCRKYYFPIAVACTTSHTPAPSHRCLPNQERHTHRMHRPNTHQSSFSQISPSHTLLAIASSHKYHYHSRQYLHPLQRVMIATAAIIDILKTCLVFLAIVSFGVISGFALLTICIWLYRCMTQGIYPTPLTTTNSYAHEVSRHRDHRAAKLEGLGRHGD